MNSKCNRTTTSRNLAARWEESLTWPPSPVQTMFMDRHGILPAATSLMRAIRSTISALRLAVPASTSQEDRRRPRRHHLVITTRTNSAEQLGGRSLKIRLFSTAPTKLGASANPQTTSRLLAEAPAFVGAVEKSLIFKD